MEVSDGGSRPGFEPWLRLSCCVALSRSQLNLSQAQHTGALRPAPCPSSASPHTALPPALSMTPSAKHLKSRIKLVIWNLSTQHLMGEAAFLLPMLQMGKLRLREARRESCGWPRRSTPLTKVPSVSCLGWGHLPWEIGGTLWEPQAWGVGAGKKGMEVGESIAAEKVLQVKQRSEQESNLPQDT